MSPQGYVIIAAYPTGVEVLEERSAPTRAAADTEFAALTAAYPGMRIILGDTSGNVLHQS